MAKGSYFYFQKPGYHIFCICIKEEKPQILYSTKTYMEATLSVIKKYILVKHTRKMFEQIIKYHFQLLV